METPRASHVPVSSQDTLPYSDTESDDSELDADQWYKTDEHKTQVEKDKSVLMRTTKQEKEPEDILP